MKKSVLFTLAFLFLAMVGGSTTLWNPSFAASEKKVEDMTEEEKLEFEEAKAAQARELEKEKAKLAGEDVDKSRYNNMFYVRMNPIMIPLVGRKGVEQMVSILVSLEVDGAYTSANVRSYSPRLADAYIRYTYDFLTEHAYSDAKLIKISAIKEQLMKATRSVVGDAVNDILILDIQQRPL